MRRRAKSPLQFLRGVGRAGLAGLGAVTQASMAALVQQAALQYGVSPALALAVATRESNLNPAAVSPAGAIGVMQLMPATAAQLGVDPTNAAQNIDGGVRYLAQLLQEFSDPVSAIAAYNWGPGNVSQAQQVYGANWLAQAPAETQAYVQAILGVSPADVAQAPVTLDAGTGQPVADSTDVSQLPLLNPDGSITPPPAASPDYGQLALVGGGILAATLLLREIF
jgi:soluble lytic murein transglycosylase-like protein